MMGISKESHPSSANQLRHVRDGGLKGGIMKKSLLLLCVLLTLLATSPLFAAGTKEAPKAAAAPVVEENWDQIIAAAKAEGTVVV
jgi:hypothetical protein